MSVYLSDDERKSCLIYACKDDACDFHKRNSINLLDQRSHLHLVVLYNLCTEGLVDNLYYLSMAFFVIFPTYFESFELSLQYFIAS